MTLYTIAGQVVLNAPIKGVIVRAAQILLDKEHRFVSGFTLRTQWREELKADKDIGGKLDQVRVEIGRGLDRLPPAVRDNFKAAMDMTGAGDHPAVIKAIHAFASLIGEGTHVSGGGPSPNGQSKTGVASRQSCATTRSRRRQARRLSKPRSRRAKLWQVHASCAKTG